MKILRHLAVDSEWFSRIFRAEGHGESRRVRYRSIRESLLQILGVLCPTNPQILCVARRISLGFCLAMVLLEVPEGRHNVAPRGSGGKAHKQFPKPRRGGTRSQGCVAPTGLDALPKPSPTTSVVGYVVSSLRDWAGGCSRPAVTAGKNSGLATMVGLGCDSTALRSSENSALNS